MYSSNCIKRSQGFTIFLFFILLNCVACNEHATVDKKAAVSLKEDSLALVNMIHVREQAMIDKNLEVALEQFSEQATWINSQGYYFEGKKHLREFHSMLSANDSLDYYYEAGNPKIRLIDHENALAYYGWKMFWFKKEFPLDTTFREIGLMTLTAQKAENNWRWIAVTNQHTPWFYQDITPVQME